MKRVEAAISIIDALPPPARGRAVLAGDWHGNTAWAMHVVARTASLGIDTIVHVGDLGVLWPGDVGNTFTFKLQRELDRHGVRLFFVDGNHDAHTALRALPRDDAGFGVIRTKAKGGRRLDLIRWVPRGHRWTWPGTDGRLVRFGGLGGAFSVDHQHRRTGRDIWPLVEEVEPQDVELLGGDPLDVLVSHDCPDGPLLASTMQLDYDDEVRSLRSRNLLRRAVNTTRPALSFCGHWHQRRTFQIDHPDGPPTTVHVMNKDGEAGNWAVLDLATLTAQESNGG